jgi:ketosteroid isomerase-like protein
MPLFTEDAILQLSDARDARGREAVRQFLVERIRDAEYRVPRDAGETVDVFGDVAYEWGTFREWGG